MSAVPPQPFAVQNSSERKRTRWMLQIPSWLGSILLHGGLLLVVSIGLRGCERGAGGGNQTEFREVGIFVKQPSEATKMTEAETESPQVDATATAVAAPAVTEVETQPPVPIQLPNLAPSVIGPGPSGNPPPFSPSRSDPGVSASTARPAAAPGKGETSFFNAVAKGKRFVYVLDSSGSMGSYGAMQVAKAELMASLQNLDAAQEFQVIFYNTQPRSMSEFDPAARVYAATSIHRTLARQFIGTVQPDGGTNHMPALRLALSLDPDVLFFLTDADEAMSAADLDELARMNRGRCKIYAVEFGKGSELKHQNFLKRIAEQSGGSYRYRDVTQFQR